MHILFAAPFGLGNKTTVWARTLPLAQRIVARGHQATIVIPPWDTPKDAGRRSTDGGADLVNVALGGGTLAVTHRMLREIADRRPEIVHVVKPRAHAGLVQWWLWHWRRRDQGGPALLLDIDDWEQAWHGINDYGPILSRFLAFQEEWGIRHADGITAASRWLEARAQAYAPSTPIRYLPNGVTAPDTPPARDAVLPCGPDGQPAPTVLYYTRYVEVSPDWLAECWRTVLDRFAHARLVVAGTPLQLGRDTQFRAAVDAVLGTRTASIEWRGYVEADTHAELYASATCAIFPARAEPLQEAKCSVRLATTLLNGVPVVASAVGQQITYGDQGAAWMVPADATATEFGKAVSSLLADPDRRLSMTAQAVERLVSAFNWASLGDELLDFYEEVTARCASRP